MDMKLDTSIDFNAPLLTPEGAPKAPVSAKGVSTPVLDGNGLNITASSDLEKLVELMKADVRNQQQKLVSQQFSVILLRLATENEQITASQKAAMEAIAKATDDLSTRKGDVDKAAESYEASKQAYETSIGALNDRLAELEAKKGELAGDKAALAELDREIAELTGRRDQAVKDCDAAKRNLADLVATRTATQVLMDLAIAELEKLVESQKVTPEERALQRERQERASEEAEQRQTDEERIAALKEKIAGYQATLASLNGTIGVQEGAVKTLEATVSQLNAAIGTKEGNRREVNAAIATLNGDLLLLESETAGLRTQVSANEADRIEKAKALEAAEAAWKAADGNLSRAIASMDGIGISVLAQAIALTADQVQRAAAELPDEKETGEKAGAIQALAESIIRAIDERNDEDLAKRIAKLPEALGELIGAPKVISPTDLPEYELRA